MLGLFVSVALTMLSGPGGGSVRGLDPEEPGIDGEIGKGVGFGTKGDGAGCAEALNTASNKTGKGLKNVFTGIVYSLLTVHHSLNYSLFTHH